jgi:hypothetical protein
MKRKMDKKEKEDKNDNTASVYNEIKDKMGDKYNEGYETSDSEPDNTAEEDMNRCKAAGHQVKIINTTTYKTGYAICKLCTNNITATQIATGYYNCSIDKFDYHKDCLDRENADSDEEKDEFGKKVIVKLDKEEQYQAELEDASLPRRFVIPQKSNKRFVWDIIIIIFAIINAVILPLDIAFTE